MATPQTPITLLGNIPVPPGTPPSQQFSLNSIDWLHVLRLLVVFLLTLLVTDAPKLMGATYVFHGTDYTFVVLPIVGAAIEAARRFLSQPPKL